MNKFLNKLEKFYYMEKNKNLHYDGKLLSNPTELS